MGKHEMGDKVESRNPSPLCPKTNCLSLVFFEYATDFVNCECLWKPWLWLRNTETNFANASNINVGDWWNLECIDRKSERLFLNISKDEPPYFQTNQACFSYRQCGRFAYQPYQWNKIGSVVFLTFPASSFRCVWTISNALYLRNTYISITNCKSQQLSFNRHVSYMKEASFTYFLFYVASTGFEQFCTGPVAKSVKYKRR